MGEPVRLGVGGLPADPGRGGVVGEFSRAPRDGRFQVSEYCRGMFGVGTGPGGRRAAPGEFRGGLGGGLLVGANETLKVC